jgi:hypothetical protein
MTSGYFNGKFAGPAVVMAVLAVVWGFLPAAGDELDADPGIDAGSAAAALSAAAIAIEHAADAGNLWLGTRDLLSRAAAHHDAGDYSQAVTVAVAARRHAIMALNQANLERARYLFSASEGDQDRDTRDAIQGLLGAHDGAAALRLLRGSGD